MVVTPSKVALLLALVNIRYIILGFSAVSLPFSLRTSPIKTVELEEDIEGIHNKDDVHDTNLINGKRRSSYEVVTATKN